MDIYQYFLKYETTRELSNVAQHPTHNNWSFQRRVFRQLIVQQTELSADNVYS